MTDLICLIDDDGKFKYASPSYVKILGYPSEIVLYKSKENRRNTIECFNGEELL